MKENKGTGILLSRSLEKLEKELYKSNSLFDEIKNLEFSLKNIEDQINNLEELTEQNSELKDFFKSEIKNKHVISKFKQLENNLTELKSTINKFEEPNFKADIFLDNYRTQTNYEFDSNETSMEFFDALFKENKIKECFVGPKLIGLIDINRVSKELNIEKGSPNLLKVKKSDLMKALLFFNQIPQKFEVVVETDDLRISFLQLRNLNVKTNSVKLRKIDKMAELFNAKIN